ncbi:MAG: hypothetical protein VW450_02820 [Chloroflexota bacterium]
MSEYPANQPPTYGRCQCIGLPLGAALVPAVLLAPAVFSPA